MSEKGWETIFGLGVVVGIIVVVCFIASLFYMSGTQTHMETMAKIEACSAEYAFNQTENVHFIVTEYCGGTVQEKVKITRDPLTSESPAQ